MSVIDPVALADIDQSEWRSMIDQAEALGVPDRQFLQIMAHAPGYAEALFDSLHRSHATGAVDHKLKEIIRIQLARKAGDGYFAKLRSEKAKQQGLSEDAIDAGCGDFDTDPRFTDAEKWALSYAYLMYRDPKMIDKAFYDEGKTHYTEAQIMELGAFIAFHYGMQVFMGTLKVVPL